MVPKGWKESRLGKHTLKVGSGITPSGGSNSYKNSGIPLIRSQNVLWGYLDLSDVAYIDDSQHQKMRGSFVKPNDVLLNITGASIGRASVVPENITVANVNQHVCIIRTNDEINPYFLLNFLLSFYGQKQIEQFQAGGNRQGLNFAQIESFRLKLPPISEQIKIAQILSTWDKAIQITEQLLTNSQQQKKALMQQLLTGKKRFPEFHGEWRKLQIADIAFINPKKTEKPTNGLVSFISMDAVSEDAQLIKTETKQYNEVKKGFTSFCDEDVIIAKITPCFENGKGAFLQKLVNKIGFGSTEFHVLRAKKGNCAKLIYYITNTPDFRIRGEANMQGSAGQKRITIDYLKLYKIFFPFELEEQEKIASLLSTIDVEIEILQQQVEQLEQEKKALMQQLLTGKTRVKNKGNS